MSVRLMTTAWALDVSATDKLVLLALADWSNDDGHCWPSMKQLASKSGLTDRAIRSSIGRLSTGGHLTRNEVPGKGVRYVIHPGTTFRPESNSPRNDVTPEPRSPRNETPQTPERRSANTSVTTNISQEASPPSRARAPAKRNGGYHRLPSDWRPTRRLPASLGAKVAEWPPGKIEDELDSLRAWAANAKNENGKGKKLCWDTAWENWLRRADDDWRSKGGHRRQPANSNGLGRTGSAAFSVFGPPTGQGPADEPAAPRRIGVGGC